MRGVPGGHQQSSLTLQERCRLAHALKARENRRLNVLDHVARSGPVADCPLPGGHKTKAVCLQTTQLRTSELAENQDHNGRHLRLFGSQSVQQGLNPVDVLSMLLYAFKFRRSDFVLTKVSRGQWHDDGSRFPR